jgi:hypothetical protein
MAGAAANARLADKRSVRAKRISTSLATRFLSLLFARTGKRIP